MVFMPACVTEIVGIQTTVVFKVQTNMLCGKEIKEAADTGI